MLHTIDSIPVPVIAAVNGPAIGAGTQLALAADLRVVSPEARFGVPAAKLGITVDKWTVRRLVSLVGGGPARTMLLGAETISAEEAFARGLANKFGDLVTAQEWARTISELAPLSLRHLKLVFNDDGTREPQTEEQLAALYAAWGSEDAQEARAARIEKRVPEFGGDREVGRTMIGRGVLVAAAAAGRLGGPRRVGDAPRARRLTGGDRAVRRVLTAIPRQPFSQLRPQFVATGRLPVRPRQGVPHARRRRAATPGDPARDTTGAGRGRELPLPGSVTRACCSRSTDAACSPIPYGANGSRRPRSSVRPGCIRFRWRWPICRRSTPSSSRTTTTTTSTRRPSRASRARRHGLRGADRGGGPPAPVERPERPHRRTRLGRVGRGERAGADVHGGSALLVPWLARDTTLWSSWVIAGPRHRVFFGATPGTRRVSPISAGRTGRSTSRCCRWVPTTSAGPTFT